MSKTTRKYMLCKHINKTTKYKHVNKTRKYTLCKHINKTTKYEHMIKATRN